MLFSSSFYEPVVLLFFGLDEQLALFLVLRHSFEMHSISDLGVFYPMGDYCNPECIVYRVESFWSDYGRDLAQILKTATCNNIFSRNMSYVYLVLFKTIFNYENHCRFKAKRALKALKRNSYSVAEDQIVTIPFSVHSFESSLWVSSLVFPQLIVHVFFPVDRK